MNRRYLIIAVAITALLALTACGGGSSAPDVDWELTISGDVSNPLTLSYADLAAMEMIDLNDILMEKSTGEDIITSWSGVPITALFEQAGVGDWVTVTAVAADGYAIEISRDEMEGGMIALKDSGEWIAEVSPDKGPIRLVAPETPGNRWVFSLTELRVNN